MNETWRIGKYNQCIVTDNSDGVSSSYCKEDHIEAYGGILVCESISRKKDAHLISAAPDLLKVCESSRVVIESLLAILIKKADKTNEVMETIDSLSRLIVTLDRAIAKAKGNNEKQQ